MTGEGALTVWGERAEVELVGHTVGRIFRDERRVGAGDVGPSGRLRLDAAATYLQDVAVADVYESGVDTDVAWVVRRTTLHVERRPRYGEQVDLTTWCSGTGAAWAERRTTVTAGGRPAIEAVALWVCLDPQGQRPLPITGAFFDPWREAAGDRRVRSKLLIPPAPAGQTGRSWAVRLADIDLMGHVNNTVAWAAVEEAVTRVVPDGAVVWGQVEYRDPIGPDDEVELVVDAEDHQALVWLRKNQEVTAVGARIGLRLLGRPV